jgi:murein DD-endopeptidase MepM/ murein hydrolase activator NlpD
MAGCAPAGDGGCSDLAERAPGQELPDEVKSSFQVATHNDERGEWMSRRQGRAAIAATLLCTLLIPAVGSPAGPNGRLQQIEAERAALEVRIEGLEGQAGDLIQRIEGLQRQMTELQIEINRLNANIARVEAGVRTQQAKIDETQVEIDKIQDLATDQAVALYKAGATDAIEALLNSTSLAELDSRAELLAAAAQQNTGALIRFGRLQVEIKDEKRALFNQQQELTAELKSRAMAKAELDKKENESQRFLTALNSKLSVARNKEGNLQDESDRIRGDLAAIQARNSVEALGTSAQGFIWPINGSVTSPYGYRWGRMHTGIDIDGYTGQPIVASKEGTVVMASYYSGYGLTVIIDHGGGYATLYAHQSRTNVSNGESVEQGDIIGYVGCTGSCTGDHLHFEVRVNGEPTDPMNYLP